MKRCLAKDTKESKVQTKKFLSPDFSFATFVFFARNMALMNSAVWISGLASRQPGENNSCLNPDLTVTLTTKTLPRGKVTRSGIHALGPGRQLAKGAGRLGRQKKFLTRITIDDLHRLPLAGRRFGFGKSSHERTSRDLHVGHPVIRFYGVKPPPRASPDRITQLTELRQQFTAFRKQLE